MDAILYTTNTGTTERYAKLLGEKTGLPVYPLRKAPVAAGAEIIYLGWLMAGGVKGYKEAAKTYAVKAVCGVGMAESGTQLDDVRKVNAIAENIPIFTVQGGFYLKKLHGIYRLMMTAMCKTAGKKLAAKPDRTAEEEDSLDLLLNGGDRVSEQNLVPLLAWYEKGGKEG